MVTERIWDLYRIALSEKQRATTVPESYFEDAVQSAALHLCEKNGDDFLGQTDAQIIQYIFGVIENCLTSQQGKEMKVRYVPKDIALATLPTEESLYEPAHLDSYSELRELRERVVQWALKRIPARHASMLRFVHDGHSVNQFAKKELMEYNAAKQLHHRAKKSLRKEFEIAQVPADLWRLGESDRMSSVILQWLVEGPHSAEILCTEIASEMTPSAPSSEQLSDRIDDTVDHSDSTDHSSAEIGIWYSAPQNGGQCEYDLS